MTEPFRRMIAFFRCNIRSFFKSSPAKGISCTASNPSGHDSQHHDAVDSFATEQNLWGFTTDAIPPLPLLLDPARLERLAFRRQGLEWRDDSILKINQCADRVLKEFSAHIVTMLKAVPIWRRCVWPKSTSEIIFHDFNRFVRWPIQHEAQLSENRIKEIYDRRKLRETSVRRFNYEWADSPLNCIEQIGFRPSNEAKIIVAISHIVQGDQGLSDNFHRQIISICAAVIGDRNFD